MYPTVAVTNSLDFKIILMLDEMLLAVGACIDALVLVPVATSDFPG